MSGGPAVAALSQAFAHHGWATQRLLEACRGIPPDRLELAGATAYGSVLDTLRHLVGSDSFDLFVISGKRFPWRETDGLAIDGLAALAAASARDWQDVLQAVPDFAAMVREVDPDDGYQRTAPLGMRLVDALLHAAEHRSQVCAALPGAGQAAPSLGVLAYGAELGLVSEVYPPGHPHVATNAGAHLTKTEWPSGRGRWVIAARARQ